MHVKLPSLRTYTFSTAVVHRQSLAGGFMESGVWVPNTEETGRRPTSRRNVGGGSCWRVGRATQHSPLNRCVVHVMQHKVWSLDAEARLSLLRCTEHNPPLCLSCNLLMPCSLHGKMMPRLLRLVCRNCRGVRVHHRTIRLPLLVFRSQAKCSQQACFLAC